MGETGVRCQGAQPGGIAFPPPSGDWGTITDWLLVLPPVEPEPKE
jgi:hypothetical protein